MKIPKEKEKENFSKRVVDFELDTTRVPISGLNETPDVSFEEAVKKAHSSDSELNKSKMGGFIVCALDFAEDKLDQDKSITLTMDEIAAINLYTQEGPFYKILNERLRNADRNKLKPFFPYLKLILKGLYKLPVVDNTVYRGVKRDLSEYFPVGKKAMWWSFSSTAGTLGVLESDVFFGSNAGEKRTMFHIKIQHGVRIKEFSAMPDEDEILLLPGFRYKVESVLKASDDIIMVQMSESYIEGLLDFERS